MFCVQLNIINNVSHKLFSSMKTLKKIYDMKSQQLLFDVYLTFQIFCIIFYETLKSNEFGYEIMSDNLSFTFDLSISVLGFQYLMIWRALR
jgi:hypothetical protein